MRIAVDFSHGLVMIDLKTLERRYFLVPTGKVTPVEVAAGTVQELMELTDPKIPGDIPVEHQEEVLDLMNRGVQDVEVARAVRAPAPPPRTVSLLSPGSLGEPTTPQDAFGIQEG